MGISKDHRFQLGCADCDVLSDIRNLDERPESFGEEVANSVSHGIGFLAVVAGAPFLIAHAAKTGGAASVVGASVFAACLLLLYLASTLYHALPRGRAKHVLRRAEHAIIYLLIAGTYTPFTLVTLKGPWGWSLFGVIWGLAIAGITLKVLCGTRYPTVAMLLYLSMGWVVLVAIRPLWMHLSWRGFLWIVLGGVAYTTGVVFYTGARRYSHFIWHLFVIAGTACHFFAVYGYAASAVMP